MWGVKVSFAGDELGQRVHVHWAHRRFLEMDNPGNGRQARTMTIKSERHECRMDCEGQGGLLKTNRMSVQR
jgi:hypothetical protein